MKTIPNQKLDEIVRLIKEVFPDHRVHVSCAPGSDIGTFSIFGAGDYESGTEMMRKCGVAERGKQVFQNADEPWHSLTGQNEGGHEFIAFCDGLPRTCHLEVYTERVPKQQTVDTGEFIEVKRTKVVCNGEPQTV